MKDSVSKFSLFSLPNFYIFVRVVFASLELSSSYAHSHLFMTRIFANKTLVTRLETLLELYFETFPVKTGFQVQSTLCFLQINYLTVEGGKTPEVNLIL